MIALRKITRCRREGQRKAQHQVDQAARGLPVEFELPQHQQGDDARGNAAAGETQHRRPVNALRPAMHQAAAGLGRRRVKQVGADSGRWMGAEQQDQQRRHQRAAATPVMPTSRPTPNPDAT